MALPLLKVGVEEYQRRGVSPSRLVLAMPWFGYNWLVAQNCSANATCPWVGSRHDIGIGATAGWPSFTCPGGVYPVTNGRPYFKNLTCPSATGLLPYSIGGEQWDEWSQTPFLRYNDSHVAEDHTGVYNEAWYENPRSLSLKSAYAKSVGARGVGMWTANSVDYSNASYYQAVWGSLKRFTSPLKTDASNSGVRCVMAQKVGPILLLSDTYLNSFCLAGTWSLEGQ